MVLETNRSSLGKGWGRFQAHARTGGRRPAGTERGVTEPSLRAGKRGKKRCEGDAHGPGPKVSRCDGWFYVSTWRDHSSQLFRHESRRDCEGILQMW